MVFSDLFFLFAFIPAFAICYMLASLWRRSLDVRNIILVIFSLIFYAWGEPVYVLLMLFSVLLNYLSGLAIGKTQGTSRRWALALGLVCNLLILGTFKYLGFFVETLSSIGISLSAPTIALPIGISFYTFQSISYLIDVYRNESPVQKRFRDLLLYISMFPQLIAGPIVRYGTIAHEINNRHVTANDLADGVYRFLRGLGKKVILANQLSELSSQFLVNELNDLTTTGAWLGIVAFTLQIYFDFSGYSDMAIGLGRSLGFHFNENFRHPYCCNSITDFWRRWHISLCSFFRDYVYIPMGGNRRHQVLNICVVWFLTGLWHGADWTFAMWGLYFALIVLFEKYVYLKIQPHIWRPLQHIYALMIIIIGRVLFYFDDLATVGQFYRTLFGGAAGSIDFVAETAVLNNFWLWVIGIVCCLPLIDWSKALLNKILPQGSASNDAILTTCQLVLSLGVLVLSVALLVGATNNAFIYTRF